ncbi:MAG: hypothetical protein MZV63_12685 [Marinilabiliales bacterium]|nr:hypothetical protein [Marinilabiliales bacterium]
MTVMGYNAALAPAGKAVDTLEVKIDSPDQEKYCRGDHTPGRQCDAWLLQERRCHTKRSLMRRDGCIRETWASLTRTAYIYIKGRSKNMLLGPSGKNIYPEEIEIADKQLQVRYRVCRHLRGT